MDTEDRDHFKTIAGASVAQLGGSQSRQTEDNSPSGLNPSWCLRQTQILFACYRKDEAHDAEIYCASVAAVLGDFPRSIVELACDPRTGVAAQHKFLPAVAEIKAFCDAAVTRAARQKHFDALPKHQKYVPPPLTSQPNLFVPDDNRRYEEMVTKAAAAPHRALFDQHVCVDNVTRNGVWVPLNWWEVGADMKDSKRAEELSRLQFGQFAADGVTIGGQPVSRELAEQFGAKAVDHESEAA